LRITDKSENRKEKLMPKIIKVLKVINQTNQTKKNKKERCKIHRFKMRGTMTVKKIAHRMKRMMIRMKKIMTIIPTILMMETIKRIFIQKRAEISSHNYRMILNS
jgi:hypothetical protein